MDLVRLNTQFVPDTLIEGYDSLIWTERFRDAGEFELITPLIPETRALLKPGSLVSLRDTTEVMFVETHSMHREQDGGLGLKITGRSFETFLENRALVSTVYGEAWPVLQQYKDSEFIALLLWNHMVNTTGEDPTRAAYVIDNKTGIPTVVVTDTSNITDVAKKWTLEAGEVYRTMREMLAFTDLGIRNVRPIASTANVMTFDTTRTANRGKITKTSTPNISQLRLDVYNGLDKTMDQSDRPSLIFHYDSGHIDDPEYLISIQPYKNMVMLQSSAGIDDVWPNTSPPPNENVTGLARRTLFVDGGNQGSTPINDFLVGAYQKAYSELAAHRQVILLDGALSLQAPYVYNSDYFLGDEVTLIGEFGFTEPMIISEFIRTVNATEERSYPGLVRRAEYESAARRTGVRP